MEKTIELLKELKISFTMTIASAHRSPGRAIRLATDAEKEGYDVIIAGAGMAAHLAGVMAAHTVIPVIGVPINSSPLNGLDSLFSTVQMPPGVPVATMAIGNAGARNAAFFAAQIIGRKDQEVAKRLRAYKKKMADEIEKKARAVEKDSSPQ
jgi:phosphoribosylamine--glycine ligase